MTATYEKIATTTLGSAASSVNFNSISGSYTDIVIIASIKNTSLYLDTWIRFNSDTGSNYSNTVLAGNGSAAYSSRASNATKINLTFSGYPDTGSHNVTIINVMNYANTTTNKTILSRSDTAAWGVDATVGLWRSTSAISTIDLLPSSSTFASGSTFTLYGIKAE
jgi:hypothetical protein